MALSVADLDAAIDALVLGAESFTTPSGLTISRVKLNDLLKLREIRKAQADGSEGGLVAQFVEFT
jgi:hypothetical protein